jgi:hypothetical protein
MESSKAGQKCEPWHAQAILIIRPAEREHGASQAKKQVLEGFRAQTNLFQEADSKALHVVAIFGSIDEGVVELVPHPAESALPSNKATVT